jgi:hypothetical protein
MNGQLRLNVILPIVLLAVVGAGLMLFMLSRGAETSTASSDSALAPLPRLQTPKTPAKAPAKAAAARPTKPVAAAKPTPAPKPKPARPKVKLNPGLPPTLARALTARPVAVVAFVTPGARLDEMAAKEAAAGASAGGASFVTVDVSKERDARPFAMKLGVLEAPTVLVFKRPGNLFVRLDGFNDLDVVAQAAENAHS